MVEIKVQASDSAAAMEEVEKRLGGFGQIQGICCSVNNTDECDAGKNKSRWHLNGN